MKKNAIDAEEETLILNCIKANGRKAYDQTLKAGIPVTILQGNTIYRVYPDGKKEVLKEVEPYSCKVAKTYTLK